MKVFPISFQSLLKVSTLLLGPDRQLLCQREPAFGFQSQNHKGLHMVPGQTCASPLAALTLNLSLLKASSVLKSHFTSSYKAYRDKRSTFSSPPSHLTFMREDLPLLSVLLNNIKLAMPSPTTGVFLLTCSLSLICDPSGMASTPFSSPVRLDASVKNSTTFPSGRHSGFHSNWSSFS